MHRSRVPAAAAAGSAALAAALVALPAEAAVPVPNGSLEQDADSNGVPDCWRVNSYGTNRGSAARVSGGTHGTWAEQLTTTRWSSGSRRLLLDTSSSACTLPLVQGQQLSLSASYKGSGTLRWVALYRSRANGSWVFWTSSPALAPSSSWRATTYPLPPAPADAAALTFGIALESVGTFTVDAHAVADTTAATSTPSPGASPTLSPSPSPSPSPTATAPLNPSPSPGTSGRRWYVSPAGDGTDGRTWATAWRQPPDVVWSSVAPGDTVTLDGGATRCPSGYDFADHATSRPGLRCGVLYTGGLDVQASGTSSAPVTVALSDEPGHDGTAVLFGGRATPLPACNSSTYSPSGAARAAGVLVKGRQHVVVDGRHRSGIMVYGAQSGVDLGSDSTAFVTLRNLELFDNGTFSTWTGGYRSDGEGIRLAGHDITMERLLVHDNGQDAVQDRYTGNLNNGSHAALSGIVVRDSWLYGRRPHPSWPGYGFSSGAQGGSQDCTHVDGIQIWGGGLHQRGLTVTGSVFGPYLAQGVYPGDRDVASFDGVVSSLTGPSSRHDVVPGSAFSRTTGLSPAAAARGEDEPGRDRTSSPRTVLATRRRRTCTGPPGERAVPQF